MAMIELAQVDLLEVFLPYLFNRSQEQTLYESLQRGGFQKMLPEYCSQVKGN